MKLQVSLWGPTGNIVCVQGTDEKECDRIEQELLWYLDSEEYQRAANSFNTVGDACRHLESKAENIFKQGTP